MATFPGDMNIGWGFGLEQQEEESHLTDPLLAVSELEQRVESLEGRSSHAWVHIENIESHLTDPLLAVSELEQRVAHLEEELTIYRNVLSAKSERITDLEERLRSLVFVVNTLCASMHDVMHREKE